MQPNGGGQGPARRPPIRGSGDIMANNGTTFRPEFWTDPRPVSAPLRNQSEVKRKESYNKLFGVGQNPLSCVGVCWRSVLWLLLLLGVGSACDGNLDCGPIPSGPVPAASLVNGPLGEINQRPVALLARAVEQRGPSEPLLGLVLGTSEQWGHHTAPPYEVEARGQRISDEFRTRLDRAFRILVSNSLQFLLLSGGAIDSARPDYVEAERAREYLIATYEATWHSQRPAAGPLTERLLLDPLAQSTPTNVRNADKLAVDMGLNQLLVITTMPERSTLSVTDLASQGYYLLYHSTSTFDSRSELELGYTLGAFSLRSVPTSEGDEPLLHHCRFNVTALGRDDYTP